MAGLEDLNQKVIIVVIFTTILLLIWWYVKTRFSQTVDLGGRGHLKHLESRRLANATVLSLFEVDQNTIVVLQDKQGSSLLKISDLKERRGNYDT